MSELWASSRNTQNNIVQVGDETKHCRYRLTFKQRVGYNTNPVLFIGMRPGSANKSGTKDDKTCKHLREYMIKENITRLDIMNLNPVWQKKDTLNYPNKRKRKKYRKKNKKKLRDLLDTYRPREIVYFWGYKKSEPRWLIKIMNEFGFTSPKCFGRTKYGNPKQIVMLKKPFVLENFK